MTALQDAMAPLAREGGAPSQRSLSSYLAPRGSRCALEVNPVFGEQAERLAPGLASLAAAAVARSWPSHVAADYRVIESSAQDPLGGVPHLLALAPDGSAAAAFVGGDLFTAPAHRRRGLAAELMLARAVLHDGGLRVGRLYTAGGLAAARASHRLAARIAFAEVC